MILSSIISLHIAYYMFSILKVGLLHRCYNMEGKKWLME